MKWNELAFDVRKNGSNKQEGVWLDIGVLIDGEAFGQDFAVDLFQFARSCQSSGEMELFTCGCGTPMCVGIYDGVRVTQTESAIEWQCPDPLAAGEDSDAEKPFAWRHFSFDPEKYAEAVEDCVAGVICMALAPPAATDLPVHGWNIEELFGLEARPFSDRDLERPRRIVARNVVVDAYVGRIIVGGNPYPIKDLNLPEELLRLNRERADLQVFPASREGIPAYEAYLDASRKFCKALLDHLVVASTAVTSLVERGLT